VDILVARTEDEIRHAFERLVVATHLGCDTETSGLSARHGRLFSVQFSDGEFNVLVPVSEGVPLGVLSEILTNASIIKIFHNAKFDLGVLKQHGLPITREVYDTLIAEFDRLKAEPITERELERAKNQFARDYILGRESNEQKARQLAHALVIHHDIKTADGEFDIFQKLTAADVQRAARTAFTPENRLVITLLPAAGSQ